MWEEVEVDSLEVDLVYTYVGHVSVVWTLYALLVGSIFRVSSLFAYSHGSHLEVFCSPMKLEWLHGFWVGKGLSA